MLKRVKVLSLVLVALVFSVGAAAHNNVVVITLGGDDNPAPAYHLTACHVIDEDLGNNIGVSLVEADPFGSGDDYPSVLGNTEDELTYLWSAPGAGIYTVYTAESTTLPTGMSDTVLEISFDDCRTPNISDDESGPGSYSAYQIKVNAGQQVLFHVSDWEIPHATGFRLNILDGAQNIEGTPPFFDATEHDPRFIGLP